MRVRRRSMVRRRPCPTARARAPTGRSRSMPRPSGRANCWRMPMASCTASPRPACASSPSMAATAGPTWRRGCFPRRSCPASRSPSSTMAPWSATSPMSTTSSPASSRRPTGSWRSPTGPSRVYNLGNNQPVKLLDFIAAIEKAAGRKAIMEMKPKPKGDVPAHLRRHHACAARSRLPAEDTAGGRHRRLRRLVRGLSPEERLTASRALHAPAHRRRVHRRVPERRRLVVQHRQRDRAAGHVERRDVGADQRARDRDAVLSRTCAARCCTSR